MIDGQHAGEVLVGAMIVGREIAAHLAKRRERGEETTALDAVRAEFAGFRREITARFDQLEGAVADRVKDLRRDLGADIKSVRVIVIGEDGENGLRSDLRKMERERERERDERHGRNNELTESLLGIEVEQRAQGERLKAVERDISRLVENDRQRMLHGGMDRRSTA